MSGKIPNVFIRAQRKKFNRSRNQPFLVPCFADDLSLHPIYDLKNLQTTITDGEGTSWKAARLPQAQSASLCQEEEKVMKMHPSSSLCHWVDKSKTEVNPKPNTFLFKLSCRLGLGDSCWRNRACVVRRSWRGQGEVREPAPGQLLTALYQSLSFHGH